MQKQNIKIAHIVNVVEILQAHKANCLDVAQAVTLKSMVESKNRSVNRADVELFAIKHVSEQIDLPSEFMPTCDLKRWCYDVFINLPKTRKLPLISDILAAVYEQSNSDYIVYTNIDIGVIPTFYDTVREIIENGGYDAFIINRKTMPKQIKGQDINHTNYTLYFDLKIQGKRHPGWDCFIFRRELIKKIVTGNIFLGYPPIGAILKEQLFKHSKKHTIFECKDDMMLTFHIGKDQIWNNKTDVYFKTNKREGERVRQLF